MRCSTSASSCTSCHGSACESASAAGGGAAESAMPRVAMDAPMPSNRPMPSASARRTREFMGRILHGPGAVRPPSGGTLPGGDVQRQLLEHFAEGEGLAESKALPVVDAECGNAIADLFGLDEFCHRGERHRARQLA